MKFLLVLTVCSAVAEVCLPPAEMWPLYDSHYDCATKGYDIAAGMMTDLGQDYVNNNQLVIGFKCRPNLDI